MRRASSFFFVAPALFVAVCGSASGQVFDGTNLRSPDGDAPIQRRLSTGLGGGIFDEGAHWDGRASGVFVTVGADPEADAHSGAAFLPNGVDVAVSSRDSKNLVVFNTSTRAVVKSIALSGTPNGVAVTADGSRAVTCNIYEGTVSIVDLNAGVELAAVPAGTNPLHVRLTPDGSKAVSMDNTTQSVYVIDVASATLLRTIPVAARVVYSTSVNFETAAVGSVPHGFELADNSTAIIADYFDDQIVIVDLNTGVSTPIACPDAPFEVAVVPGGSKAVVTHYLSTRRLSVVDVPARAISSSITTTADLWGPVAVNPAGTLAVVAIQNNCLVIDLATGAASGSLATNSVDRIWTTADGNYALCAGFRGSLISYATKTIVKDLNNFVFCTQGAVAPVGTRAVQFSDVFGEDMVVLDTNGAAGSLLSAGPSGPAPEGDRCRAVAISADGTKAVAVSQQSQTAAVVDVASRTVIGWADVDRRPGNAEITPDGTKAVVASRDGVNASIINLGTASVTNVPISTRADQVQISPDSQFAYLAVVVNDGVWRINLNTNTVQGAKLVTGNMGGVGYLAGAFSGMTLSPNGGTLVTCNSFDNSISIIDTAAWSVVKTLALGAGTFPTRAVFSPDNTRIYVANRDNDTVSVVSNAGAASAVIGTAIVGDQPFELAVTPGGSTLYVANFGANTVRAVNTATLATVATITAPTNEFIAGLELTPAGDTLYVATGNASVTISANVFTQAQTGSVLVVDTATNTIDETITTGRFPAALDIASASATAVTAEPWGDGVTLVVSCPADFNADGFVTGDDFDQYVAAFELGNPAADFNHDGFVTGDDFDAFVVAFEAGC